MSDHARHEVADGLAQPISVRASGTMLPLLAERPSVYPLGDAPDARRAVTNVDRVVVTDQDVQWTDEQWQQFSGGMALQQFVLVYDRAGVKVYTRLSSA